MLAGGQMFIQKGEVEYIERLARIRLEEKERREIVRELSQILEYIDMLKEAKIEERLSFSKTKPLLREDEIKPSLDQRKVLESAPQREGDFFKVPKVL
ncbi:MAG: Asp-tRNA(Asn)/Glu-tRNA(Gln) amidotransferase subunit GatB [Candidatus Omnitrophota bacterium]|nr:MAG: Asp-tRNA(Asn)/Glu-tRNA(Gln) amidotransferase subunit GatB [Candidatus Omnitrophota bacterium]